MIPSPKESSKIDMYPPAFYAACTAGGILSCGLTHMAVTPLDLVKCNMQIDPTKYKSISSGFGVLLKEQGVKGLSFAEITATRFGVLFDRSSVVRLSGMSKGAYIRSYNLLHNGLDVKLKLDLRDLATQFGCIRIMRFVRVGLKLWNSSY